MMRKLLGIVIGVAFAAMVVTLIGLCADQLFPSAIDISVDDETAFANVIADKTMPEKILWVAPWLLGSFGGAWLALRICDWKWAGWIVAGLMMAFTITEIVGLPHPLWMQACAILFPLLGGWLAIRIHHKPYPGEPLLG